MNNSVNIPDNNRFVRIFVLFILIFSLFFFISCKKRQVEEQTSTTSRIEVTTSEIVITYLDGDVYKNITDEWIELYEDDLLIESDIVKTESDSYCELQFGDIALVRVQENSVLRINSVLTEFGKTDIELGLNLGTVLCKVEKLIDDESFQVETPGSVCGVRGTRFGVEVNESEDVSLFVEEGACAVIPLSVAPDRIKEKLINNPELAKILIQEVEKNALVVNANQEVQVSKSSLEKTEKKFEEVNNVLAEISKKEKEEIDDKEKENLKKLLKTSTGEAFFLGTEVSTVSETHKTDLKNLENIRKKDIKIKTRELKLEEEKKEEENIQVTEVPEKIEIEKEQETEDKKEKEIKQKITVHTTPAKAKVYLNDEFLGYTPITINDMLPGTYKFLIKKDEYKNYEKEIDLIAGNDQFHDLILVREGPPLSKISIHTIPEKVSVYLNNEYIGKTPCNKNGVKYGEYEIMLQLRGYSFISERINIDEENEKLMYQLKADNCEVATIKDLINFLGPPGNYSSEKLSELREMESLAEPVDFIYAGRFYFEIIDIHLTSILLTGDKKDFTFRKMIGINSPREDIEEIFGEPGTVLAEGKLLRYRNLGLTIELDTEGLVSSFRLYKLDPLLTLDPIDNTDPDLVEFYTKLKDFPSRFGIE